MKNDETVMQGLKKLYRKYGYSQFKMSKFEEYDTYVQNKDFLISDKVITFTDTNGKLLAMKPDVTISIIKNTDDTEGYVQKMYYNENVYRVSGGAHAFKEIMQAGLECIGNVDAYSICEVIMLAVRSLAVISEDFVLDISHMGFVAGLLEAAGFSAQEKAAVLLAVSEKNLPELSALCRAKNLSEGMTERITGLASVYGPIKDVMQKLDRASVNTETEQATKELRMLCDVLEQNGLAENVQIDFSVVNDMNYYNGIVFRGYVKGIPTGVLSGGQYDKLMEKMGKNAKAVGFAVYLDLLERLEQKGDGYDVDVLLCYDDSVPVANVFEKAQEVTHAGKSVLVQRCAPDSIRYREKITLTQGGAEH